MTAPKSTQKFSLDDIKSIMVKKEKGTSTPAPKPVRVPDTRLSKKKRVLEPVVNLDTFEDLDAFETTDRMLLAVQHLRHLLNSQADELREANERWVDLQKIAAEKDAHFKKLEASWEAEALARENQAFEDAKICATTSVMQAMYEMAKEAAADNYLHPNWDVSHWAQVLEKPEIVVKKVQKDGKAGDGEGTSGGAPVGDEGDMTA